MDRKLLTAEKILDNVEFLMKELRPGREKNMRIVTLMSSRNYANFIPFEILMKKYLLQKGILNFHLNKLEEAQDCFLECMETHDIFDPRIKKECIKNLIII